MNRKEFVELEFKKRNIPVITDDDRIEEGDFSRMWDSDEPVLQELSEAEKKAQAAAEKEAGVPYRRWRYPKDRKALERDFDAHYKAYVLTGQIPGIPKWESPEGHLLDLLGQLYTYRAFLRIRSLLVYIAGDEEDIVQAGHIGALQKFRKDRETGTVEINPVQYFTAIYKNKTRDYLRHYNLLKTPEELKAEKEQEKEERGNSRIKPSVYDFRNTASLDEMAAGSEGDDLSDRIRALSTNFLEDDLFNYEDLNHMVTTAYLMCLLNNKNVPAAPISVMYARVLFQLERLMNPESIEAAIGDYIERSGKTPESKNYAATLFTASRDAQKYTTASSVKWALDRMGTMTVSQLVADSELSLHINFDEAEELRWGEPLQRQLDLPVEDAADTLWKDLVPTSHFPEDKISDWALDVHNSAVVTTAKALYQDEELRGCVMQVLSSDNKLVKEIRKREKKDKQKQAKQQELSCSGKEARA